MVQTSTRLKIIICEIANSLRTDHWTQPKNYATLKQLTEVKDFISKDLVVKDDYNEFKSVTEKAVFEINSDIGTI